MDKLYRINYIVDKDNATCTIYTYPILDEKNTYFLIRSGQTNRQIKKDIIGELKNTDMDRTGYHVFLTGLENKHMYVEQMIKKVKDNARKQVQKFQSIYDNAIQCDIKIVDVEPE